MGGIASAIGSVVGSVAAGVNQTNATKAEKSYIQDQGANATAAEQNQMKTTTQNFQPYTTLGASGANQLNSQLGNLTQPINIDQATLESTPGYQFELNQGLKSTQNSAASRGLGVSGASQKAAADFTQGLASNNYQQQFNNALANNQNIYNHLLNTTSLGTGATGQLAALGQNNANALAQNYQFIGGNEANITQTGANSLNSIIQTAIPNATSAYSTGNKLF